MRITAKSHKKYAISTVSAEIVTSKKKVNIFRNSIIHFLFPYESVGLAFFLFLHISSGLCEFSSSSSSFLHIRFECISGALAIEHKKRPSRVKWRLESDLRVLKVNEICTRAAANNVNQTQQHTARVRGKWEIFINNNRELWERKDMIIAQLFHIKEEKCFCFFHASPLIKFNFHIASDGPMKQAKTSQICYSRIKMDIWHLNSTIDDRRASLCVVWTSILSCCEGQTLFFMLDFNFTICTFNSPAEPTNRPTDKCRSSPSFIKQNQVEKIEFIATPNLIVWMMMLWFLNLSHLPSRMSFNNFTFEFYIKKNEVCAIVNDGTLFTTTNGRWLRVSRNTVKDYAVTIDTH